MIILGVGWLSDASAAIVRDGRLIAAVSEERINREKLWYGYPALSIAEVLRLSGVTIDDVDLIATYGQSPKAPDAAAYEAKEAAIAEADLPKDIKERQLAALHRRRRHEESVFLERNPQNVARIEALGRPVVKFRHHDVHAASAYYGSGWENCLAMTADGWGDAASGGVFECTPEKGVEALSYSHTFDSLGYFYGSFTKSLGFIPHRHEGKVLGLAAYCETPQSYADVSPLIDVDTRDHRFIGRMEGGAYVPNFDNPAVDRIVSRYSREDIASAVQRRLEEVVTAQVSSLGDKARRIALAGGVFANVKLNQRIAALDNVEEVYVFPHMGDGGLSAGAAFMAYHERSGLRPSAAGTMYLGPAPEEADIMRLLQEGDLEWEPCANITSKVASLLADGQVVARCTGRMEFGPRALGHRSILYQATDASVNSWLNDYLHRSEFMPFAPVTLEDAAHEMYLGLDKGRIPARFMAMTFDCTERMKREAPAAVHVDGTARPQVVSGDDNPDLHAILASYREKTGLSSLINTSFNMHEEPIVRSAEDALRAFRESGLPYLALGDFLVRGAGKA